MADQRAAKLAEVAAGPTNGFEPYFVDTPALGLRDRVDLTWARVDGHPRLGFYKLVEPGAAPFDRVIIDVPACPMMSPALETFYKEVRTQAPPIEKGSVRLRVGPDGRRGIWLDFANQDVKALFDEGTYLAWLSELAFVEIGQRRKRLVFKDGRPKLVDPDLRPWFETYDAEGRGIPLYGPVGGFSQSGFIGNRALIGAVSAAVERAGLDAWLELFGGNGNFALALASRGARVQMFEVDELAVRGAHESLARRLDLNVTVTRLDAYAHAARVPGAVGRGLIVDPPRAGLKNTLSWIEREQPPAIVYVSCFTSVFNDDAAKLRAMGYRLETLVGVDQFAQSPHAEWVALFKF